MIDALPGAWGLALAAVRAALTVWALAGAVFAALPPASAYSVEGKLSKPAWVGICVASAAAIWFSVFGLLSIAGVVAVGVFYADVRPAVGSRRR